jgi:hypothetical protein
MMIFLSCSKLKYRQDPSKFIGRRWCRIFIPKTNSTLGKDRHDDYNVAGYGTSIKQV